MEIKTQFNIGDLVWVVINSKAAEIEVVAISVTKDGIFYGESRYGMHHESECFATKPELLEYVAGE